MNKTLSVALFFLLGSLPVSAAGEKYRDINGTVGDQSDDTTYEMIDSDGDGENDGVTVTDSEGSMSYPVGPIRLDGVPIGWVWITSVNEEYTFGRWLDLDELKLHEYRVPNSGGSSEIGSVTQLYAY